MAASLLECEMGWTDEANAYLALAAQAPSRRVGGFGGHHNCVHVFPSEKMRFTLRAESHLERGCFLRLEYDEDVIAYYDQPPSVELSMLSKTGRRLRVRYTPDVLVKRRTSLEILEVKTIQACENLVADRPHVWKKIGGGYIYVPARDYFAKWNISFRVVTEAEQNPLETENLELLGRLSRASAGTLRKRQLVNLHSLLEGKVLTIDYLAKRLALTDLSGLIELVRQKQLHCDIRKSNLSMPEEALVSLDPELLRSAHEGFARLKVDSSSDAREILSPTEAAVALKRYEILTGAREPDCCKRTIQLWKKSLGQAKGDLRALSPKWGRCGNWRVLDDSVAKALDEGINGYFKETAEGPAQTWLDYRANNPDGVSFPTFLKYLRRREASDQEGCAKARAGQRAANAAAPPTLPTLRYVRATRPFQRAHCDHKLLNNWVLVGESGGVEYRAKPWLTALYDEATDDVLAWTISLDSPSRRHVARVMRECVRRHGRLPETIVVDGGSDFRSTFFEQFIASRHIEKKERPTGDPRYGSNIERSFGVIKGELTSVLPGNTTNDERKRFASATSKGGKTSVVDIVDLHDTFVTYFDKIYNGFARPSKRSSPEALLARGIQRFPFSGVKVEFDYEFIVATSVPLHDTYLVDITKGIRHLDRWFVCDAIRCRSFERGITVAEDPDDKDLVHALVDGDWHPCFSGPRRDEESGSPIQAMYDSVLFLERRDIQAKKLMDRKIAARRFASESASHIEKSTKIRASGNQGKASGANHKKRIARSIPTVKAGVTTLPTWKWGHGST